MKIKLFLCLIFVLSVSLFNFAHAPIISNMSGADISKAIPINDIQISQVLYKVFEKDSSFVWLTFQAKKGENLYFQVGTPKTDKYKELKPAVAIVGPGLSKTNNLPFQIPHGIGALLFESSDQPQAFYEPVTDTNSWIHITKTITLPETGKYYIVGYFPPNGQAGNLFIAVGKIERFTWQDIVNVFKILPEIRAFYGLSGLPGWMNVVIGLSLIGLLALFVYFFR
uniref:Uncharacterized protein n=1 Tax=Fervidobacterium pennivorans TaxID=93466 RepID=A0A7C4VWS9_FERPE